ncbi:MAG: PqqD family protein [Ruminococcaceae bacterium]|nr:PqqD family protein [Oscillospiraceae bacterium]
MKIKPGYMLREVAGCNVVVSIGVETMDFGGMINLNDSGAFLWKLLENGATQDELLEKMLEEYDVDEKTAKEGINAFINKIREADLLDE